MLRLQRKGGHVPPPDPAVFWPFTAGQTRIIMDEPILSFTVTAIHDDYIEGIEVLGDRDVTGRLHMDRSCVMARDGKNEALVTLTLRKIEDHTAYLQVTCNPK